MHQNIQTANNAHVMAMAPYYNNERIHTALKMSPRDYAKSLDKSKFRMDKVFVKEGA